MTTNEKFTRFLHLLLAGGVFTRAELERELDCSRSLVRNFRARANRYLRETGTGQAVAHLMVNLKSGQRRWCYFMASDYEAALPSADRHRKMAIGNLKAERDIWLALLSNDSLGEDERSTVQDLVSDTEEALEVLSG